jgi:uncharacterized membrane protein HdeD (DUF308 family)
MQVFIVRGLVAVVWAAVFATVADSLTLGTGILVVLYPLIDVVASFADARGEHGPARRTLLIDAGASTVAAVALAIAATGSVANVLAVFGVWALLAGAAQLVTALRRRAQYGSQWPMRLAGAGSVLFGVAFILASMMSAPTLSMIAVYAATGGLDFIIQAALLARRRHHTAVVAAA